MTRTTIVDPDATGERVIAPTHRQAAIAAARAAAGV